MSGATRLARVHYAETRAANNQGKMQKVPAEDATIVVPNLPPPPPPPDHPCASYGSHLETRDPNRRSTCLRCGRSVGSKIPKMPPSAKDCVGRTIAPPLRPS